MEEVAGLISTLGFPMFVAVWFMFRTEKVISANTLAVNELMTVVKSMGGKK